MRLQQQAQLRRHAAARAGARALRRQGESELGRFAAVARDDVGLHLSVSESQFGAIERSRFARFGGGAAG